MPVSVFMDAPPQYRGGAPFLMLRAYGEAYEKTEPWGGPCIGFCLNFGPSLAGSLVHDVETWILEGAAGLQVGALTFCLTAYDIPIDLGGGLYQAAPRDVLRVAHELKRGFRPWVDSQEFEVTSVPGEGVLRVQPVGNHWKVVRGSYASSGGSLALAVAVARALRQTLNKLDRSNRYHRDLGI